MYMAAMPLANPQLTPSTQKPAQPSTNSPKDSAPSTFEQLLSQKSQGEAMQDAQAPIIVQPQEGEEQNNLLAELAALLLSSHQAPSPVQLNLAAPTAPDLALSLVPVVVPTEAPAQPTQSLVTQPEILVAQSSDGDLPSLQPQQKTQQIQANTPQTEALTTDEAAQKPAVRIAPVQGGAQQDTAEFQTEGEALAKPLFQNIENMPVKVGETPLLDTQEPNFKEQLAQKVTNALQNGEQKISIRLAPANLGTLVVELTRTPEGVLSVLLRTSGANAANTLNGHTAELGNLLRNNTQQPVYVEVMQPEQQQDYQQQHSGKQQQQQSEQQQQPEQKEAQDFLQQLRLGITTIDASAS